MADQSVRGCRILVVEDEYMLAKELAYKLADAGAKVLGPVATMDEALIILRQEEDPDGAILDVNLGGIDVFPLADTLMAGKIPFVFTTGYDADTLPERFKNVPKCGKPINVALITAAIERAIHGSI